MKKVLFALVVLSLIGGLAYYFTTSNLKGDFSGTDSSILNVSGSETGTTEIDWDSSDEYTLGKWKVSTKENMSVSNIEASVQGGSANLNAFFNEVNLKMSPSDAPEVVTVINDFMGTNTYLTLEAGKTYQFEVRGKANKSMKESYSYYLGQETRLTINTITVTDADEIETTYNQSVDAERVYFSGDQYDSTYKKYYANGGYVITSKVAEPVSDATTALTISEAGGTVLPIDWADASRQLTLGEWNVKVSQDMMIYGVGLYIGTPKTNMLLNYFDDITLHEENIADSTQYYDHPYGEFDGQTLLFKGDWKFTVKGTPKFGIDFSSLEGSKVAMTIERFTFIPADPAFTIYDLSDPKYSGYFSYDSATYSFGGIRLTTKGYVPEQTEVKKTRAIVMSILENSTSKDITGRFNPEDVHVYGPNGSGTEVTDAQIQIKTSRVGISTVGITIPTESTTDEYSIQIAADGYVAKGFGPYSTSVDLYTASTEKAVVKIQYAYYVKAIDIDGTKIAGAVVTTNGDASQCDDIVEGFFGCHLPLASKDLTFQVIADGYDMLSSTFTIQRTLPSDFGEIFTAVMYKPGTAPDITTGGTGDTNTDVTTDENGVTEVAVVTSLDESPDTSAPTGVFTPNNGSSSSSSSGTPSLLSEGARLEVMTDENYNCVDPFTDTLKIAAKDLICRLYNSGIFSGKSTTIFAPYDYITRAEFLKISLLNAGYTIDDTEGLKEYLSDVKDSDWYSPYVKIAATEGFISQSSGKFNPNEKITRADAILLTMRIAKLEAPTYTQKDIPFKDIKVSDYFADAIMIGVETKTPEGDQIISGYSDGTYRPGDYIRRYESASIIDRTYLAIYQ